MNKIAPIATVAKRDFGACSKCGTKVSPGVATCELCTRQAHYFSGDGQPKAEVPPTYGRNN